MYVCMYVCIYIYIYICIYIHICAYIYIYIYMDPDLGIHYRGLQWIGVVSFNKAIYNLM